MTQVRDVFRLDGRTRGLPVIGEREQRGCAGFAATNGHRLEPALRYQVEQRRGGHELTASEQRRIVERDTDRASRERRVMRRHELVDRGSGSHFHLLVPVTSLRP